MSIDCELTNFEDFWGKYEEGQGPGGHYVRGLSEQRRAALRDKLCETVLGGKPDGAFTLKAKAWAVKGAPR